MDRRGTKGVLDTPRRAPPKEARGESMRPERYVDTHLRDLAKRINAIRLASRWHLEAKRFLCDLRSLGEVAPHAPSRA